MILPYTRDAIGGIPSSHMSAGKECNEHDNGTRPISYLGWEGGKCYFFKMVRIVSSACNLPSPPKAIHVYISYQI